MTAYFSNLFGELNPFAIVIIALILGILVTAFVGSIIIRSRYRKIFYDIQDKENRDMALFESKVLNYIVDDYKIAAKGNRQINTQAIIEKNFNNELSSIYTGERFVQKSVSLMIILGLLGTFYGLTLSIGKLVELLSNSNNTDVIDSMDSVVSGLINSVEGMSVAFVTSLFGIASSIVITIFNTILGVEDIRESVMIEIEEYLDNVLAEGIEKPETAESIINDELKLTIKEFGDKLEKNVSEISDIMSYRFTSAANSIDEFSGSLAKSVDKFDESLKTFSENTRDFTEFNHHLKTNIQRMNVTFDDFTEELRTSTKDLAVGQEVLKELSKSIEDLAKNIEKM